MSTIELPVVDRPLVSVVMVVYGGWDWVRDALVALVENTAPCYEVVIVDNASPDGTADRISAEVQGATIVLNESNVGFGAGANQGALHAVGRHLLFLNSDAFVQPGWLPPLLEMLDENPAVAAVAPCLLDPDGSLQEAGGIIAADGFAGQLGLGADADRPEFLFRREIDFSSAAALLVRRREFLVVGGFHPDYAMGYFEDVDLCLTFWDRGLATVYEPRSRVVHLRGASGSEELAQRYAAANHSVLMRRWSTVLEGRPALGDLSTHPHRLVAARDARATDRVLLLTDTLPNLEGRTEEVAVAAVLREFLILWPRVRFTLLAAGIADCTGAEPLMAIGLEVGVSEDWEQWLAARRFHYSSVIVLGTDVRDGELQTALERSQPQALRAVLSLMDLKLGTSSGRDGLVELMVSLGVGPPEAGLGRTDLPEGWRRAG